MNKRLQQIRKYVNYTQKQMADFFDISKSTYARYESGERDIPSSILPSLTDFNIDLTWLLTGKGQMIIPQEPEEPQQTSPSYTTKCETCLLDPSVSDHSTTYQKTPRISMQDIFDRIQQIESEVQHKPTKDITNAAVADLLGLTAQSLSRSKSGNAIPYDKIVAYAISKDVNIDWMLTGIGDKMRIIGGQTLQEIKEQGLETLNRLMAENQELREAFTTVQKISEKIAPHLSQSDNQKKDFTSREKK